MSVNMDKIEEHAKAIAGRENCVLYDIELAGAGKNRILRVYIDKDGKDGVSISDCSNVSRALDLILDVEDLMEGGAFNLEVSSPGLERQLRHVWHFEKAVGQRVRLQMVDPIVSDDEKKKLRKKITGVLGPVVDGHIEIRPEDGSLKPEDDGLKIPLENVKKAQVVFDFNQGYHPKQ